VKGQQWRDAWRRALADRAAQQRRQRARPRKGLPDGPGMVRVPPVRKLRSDCAEEETRGE
jgi:hypothetical protein